MINLIIYADVLIVLNAYVDYILILSTEKIFKAEVRLYRRLLGAFTGALTSLVIFLPIKTEFVSFLLGIISAMLISSVSFGLKNIRIMLKCCFVMYALSCAYCGIMLLLWQLTQINGIIINNNIVYFNISPLFLILSTVVCYAVISFISKLLSRRRSIPACTVDITLGDKCLSLKAMVDTGNTLHDSLSGLPVIIIDNQSGLNLLGVDLNDIDTDTLIMLDLNGFRLIPCSSAVGKACLPAFRPDSLMLCVNNEYSFLKAYVAVSQAMLADGFSAIVGAQSITDKETMLCL